MTGRFHVSSLEFASEAQVETDARTQGVEGDGVDRDSKAHALADRDVGADPDQIVADRVGDVEIVIVDQALVDSIRPAPSILIH